MIRRLLLASVSWALSVSSVMAAGEGTPKRADSPDTRYYVVGENSEYFRPGAAPRPVAPNTEQAENYFLKQRLAVLERRLRQIEDAQRQDDSEHPEEPAVKAVNQVRRGESGVQVRRVSSAPDGLPAPRPQKVAKSSGATTCYQPLAQAPSSLLPPPILDKPSVVEAMTVESAASRPALLQAKPLTVSYPSPDTDVWRAAAEIMTIAKTRVLELFASAKQAKSTIALAPALNEPPQTVAMDDSTDATGPKAERAPPLPQWTLTYRLSEAARSHKVEEQLEMFRIPITARSFADGEYRMEVGKFSSEQQAQTRQLFLSEVVGIKPELTVVR